MSKSNDRLLICIICLYIYIYMYMYKSFFVCMPLGGKGEVVFDKD